MYEKKSEINAYEKPMMISPAAHFSMGGLWVNYELMTNNLELFTLREADFGDHGANRLGTNSLLQGGVGSYFIAPYTIGNCLAEELKSTLRETTNIAFEEAERKVKKQLEFFINN